MPDFISLQVTALQPDPVEPAGGTATITVQSGDTVYYADTQQVGSTNNQGSLTVGQSASFSGSTVIWLRSASLSQVQVQVQSATSQTPSSAVSAVSLSGDTTGATDQAAIQAALTAAATAGGGRVQLKPSTSTNTAYVTGLVIDTGVILDLAGCVVQLANNSNKHVVATKNFSTLTGTDSTSGSAGFQVVNGTIDGNKANQTTAGHGVAIYGYHYRLANLTIRNCFWTGVWSEWGSSSLGSGDQMESFLEGFKIHDCNGVSSVTVQGGGTTSGKGCVFIGPHDSKIKDGILFYNGTAVGDASVVLDFPTNGNANGTEVDGVHVWGNNPGGGRGGYDYGIRVAASGMTLGQGVEVESAAVAGVLLTNGTNRCNARVFHVGSTYRAVGKGVVFANAVSAVHGTIRTENCGGGSVDIGTGGGGRDLRINSVYTAIAAPGTVLLGTIASTDHIDHLVTDSSGGSTLLNSQTQIVRQGAIAGAVRQQAFPALFGKSWLPTGAKRENYPRILASNTEVTPSATGTMYVFAGPYYFSGDIVTAIALRSGSVAIATPTHQWFALMDQSLSVLAKTVDDLTTAWATFTTKTLNISPDGSASTTYTFTQDTQTYVGVVISAATAPSFRGVNNALGNYSPILQGTSTTGLTTPASLGATATALTQSGGIVPYVYTT